MKSLSWFACAAITCAICAGCASGSFLIVEYPVDLGADAVAADADAGDAVAVIEKQERSSRYWSAYARLETRDIPRLWEATDRDYLLISAKVTLPTQKGKIERDFPLFIIEDGQVQRQQGVDLLQKFPLSKDARDQVMVKLEIRYIADKETLDLVRKILDEAATAAKPYLGNFAVGAQILGSAIPLIDRVTSTEEIGPSSAAFAVIPAELSTESAMCENGSSLRAFLLFPFDDDEERKKITAYETHVRECRDFRGRLCKVPASAQPEGYREQRVDDVVYLTIEFVPHDSVLDPAILVRGSQAHCALITEGAIASAQQYLADNAHLFSIEDVDAAQSSHQAASDYLALRHAMEANDIQALLQHLEGEIDRQPNVLTLDSLLEDHSTALEECWKSAWEKTPAVEVWQVWSLYRTAQSCERVAGDAALRVDLLYAGLEKLARMTGRTFQPAQLDVWQGMASPILELMQMELARAYQEQDDIDYAKAQCSDDSQADALARGVSIHCASCWKELKAACKGRENRLEKLRIDRRSLIERMLEHARKHPEGTLASYDFKDPEVMDLAAFEGCQP